jgi:hypothetical protein
MEAVVLGEVRQNAASQIVSRYDIEYVEMYGSARKHGVDDADIDHAVHHAVVVADQDDGKVLYLGPDRATNFLEVVAVRRHDGTEIVIHAMRMRRIYESFLREKGDADG